MCNVAGIVFVASRLLPEDIESKRVLEVGSYDHNGAVRPVVSARNPAEYIGVDIEPGPGVDQVCDIACLVERFGEESFDLVLCTEVLEHVEDWRAAISNLKRVCKAGGIILLTTRSLGFQYHGYPHDFWRFEVDDMERIFADFEIMELQKDRQDPGVFLKARKPGDYEECDLADISLYHIVSGKAEREPPTPSGFSPRHFVLSSGWFLERVIKDVGKTVRRGNRVQR